MKKKFGIILAILLCVVLLFTFVACNKDKTSENSNTPSDGKTTESSSLGGVTNEQITQMAADIDSYLDKWLLANAEDTVVDKTDEFGEDLSEYGGFAFADKDDGYKEIAPNVTVDFDETNGQYKIKFTWKKGKAVVTKEYTKKVVTVKYDNWAGVMNKTADYTALTEENTASGALDAIVNALFSTVNVVADGGSDAKFGMDGTIGFEAMGYKYGLRVRGNVDLDSAKDTELAFLVVNGSGATLGGLYYKGADKTEDCKLILQIKDTYKYIDYADLNSLLSFLKANPQDEEEEKTGNGLPTGTLAQILQSFGVDKSIAGTVGSVIEMLAKGYVKEGRDSTTYLIDFNLSSILSTVSELGGDLIPEGMFEGVPVLEDLDFATMHGLLGHITIAATLKGAKKDQLTDFELAFNIPECTFYFSADETNPDTKFNLPSISFALFVKDFSFISDGATKVSDVIPAAALTAAAKPENYFSPANINFSGDVYIYNTDLELDDTYHFALVTEINPFNMQAAKASFSILRNAGEGFKPNDAKNFLTITYEQKTKTIAVSGTVLGLADDENGTKLNTFAFTSGATNVIKKWIGIEGDNWHGLSWSDEKGIYIADASKITPGAKAVFGNKLAENLMKYYAQKSAGKSTANAEGEDGAVGSANEEESDIMSNLGTWFNELKALYEELEKDGTIAIDTKNASAKLNVLPAAINKVTAQLNKMFNLTLPTDIKEPEFVKVFLNTTDGDKDYTNKLFVSVKVNGSLYDLTFDNSKEDTFEITFVMTTSSRVYTAKVIVNDKFTVTFDVTDREGASKSATRVTCSDFSADWGSKNDVTVPSAEEIAASDSIFAEDGVATKLAEEIMKLLNKEDIVSYAEMFGKFVIRQIVK